LKYDFSLDMDNENSVSIILKQIQSGSKVLEFGPAMGRMTKYLKNELKCQVFIVELDEEGYNSSRQYAVDGYLGNAEKIEWADKFKEIKFDYIIFADVLEHLRNPEEIIMAARNLLAFGGKLIVSVPNVAHNSVIIDLINNKFTYRKTGLLDDTHIKFFTYYSLQEMLVKCNLVTCKELATYAQPYETEFYNRYEMVIKELSDKLKSKEFGDVYQYVFTCIKKEDYLISKENIIIEKKISKISPVDTFKVYINDGSGLNENNTLVKYIFMGENHINLNLEKYMIDKEIRLDFTDESCIVKLDKLSVDDNEYDVNSLGGNYSYKFRNYYIFLNNDPFLFLKDIPLKCKTLSVDFSVYQLYHNLLEFEYLNNINLLLQNISSESENKLNELNVQLEEQENELKEQLEGKENDIILLEAKLYEKQVELEDNKKNIFESNKAINELKEQLLISEKKLKLSNDEIKEKYDNLNVGFLTNKQEIARLNNELSLANHNYSLVVQSKCWKLTQPIRYIANSMKNLLKANRFTRLIALGLISLKRNGIKETYKIVKNRKESNNFVEKFEQDLKLSEQELEKQINTNFAKSIKFSIVVPLYNTKDYYLTEMIDSVIEQTYSNWELCLADGSDNEHENVKNICLRYSKRNNSIKYIKLRENAGISGNTIEAYKMADGDFIVLLDHDDLLTKDALYELACCIEKNPNVDFIYSDRGIFSDETKKLLAYHFLPGFSPDFLRACNYASHLNAFSKYIIGEVGFIRTGYDGSQDYDFELRVIEKARDVVRIPKVLYYCRACEGSVALDPKSKMYAYEAGRISIDEHIKRIGYPGKVEFLSDTFSYRIHYDIKKENMVSIIIPNCDHVNDLKRCVDSILNNTDYAHYEILIVENNSKEQSTFDFYEKLKSNGLVNVISYETNEFNYSAINNYGVNHTNSPYLLFLNNDTEIINSGWLREMLMFCQRNDVGAVGAKLYYSDETFQHVGLFIGLGGHIASHYDHRKSNKETGYMHRLSMPQNYNAITAACLLVKREDFISVNGFDEENFKIGLNDIDLCLKLRELGKINVLTPYAELYHYESSSRGSDEEGESKKRYDNETKLFRAKWMKYYENYDEYTNPNFRY